MSKLLKFKSWLTLQDAANRLSISAGEPVSEADILRLGLDGHLKLSVHFVNHARARMGKVVPWSETRWSFAPPMFEGTEGQALTEADIVSTTPEHLQKLWRETPIEFRDKYRPFLMSLVIDETRFLNLASEVSTLTDVWDLPMLGNEKLDVERAYQQLTGGPNVTLAVLEGTFVSQGEDVICQLQESWDQNPFQRGSMAQLERLKAAIFERDMSKERADEALQAHKEDRTIFLENTRKRPESDRYDPADGLPEDAVLVVRTAALSELENQFSAAEELPEKPLDKRELRSAGLIIAALSAMAKLDLTEPYTAAGKLESSAASNGLFPPTRSTIVKYFEAAKKAAKTD